MSFIDQPAIQFADNAVTDAFGNLRTVTPHTIFNSKQIADGIALSFENSVSGVGATATFDTNKASTLMTVPATTVSSVIRQTKRWMNYQSGKSQKVTITTTLWSGSTGIRRRVGLFETNNWLFFQLSASTLSVVMRTNSSGSAVDTVIPQSSWNIDKLDGSAGTYTTLDLTKTQILVIDYQWLGAGRVRFWFSIDGRVHYCHQILNANVNALPYISNPNLPIRYEITNDGTGVSSTLRAICAAVESEGGEQEIGLNRSLTRGTTALTTNNDSNLYPLIAFRLKSGYAHSQIQAIKYSIACTSTSLFEYQLIVNPTVTGTAFSYTSLANSGVEYDVSRTNTTTVSGGDMLMDVGLDSVWVISTVVNSTWKPGTTIAGVSDVVVLAVRRLTGTSETFYANLVFNEML